jgi:dipeptidyl aminopeptidase/acylaminoacyl peptidase
MTWKNQLVLGLLLAGTASAALAEQARDEAAVLFGTREYVLDISLSPSGEKIAFISAGPEHGEILSYIDLSADAVVKPILVNSDIIADLDGCEWADDDHLVCTASGMGENAGVLIPFDRLFAIEAATGKVAEISRQRRGQVLGFAQRGGDVLALDVGGEQGRILVASEAVREYTTGTRITKNEEGMGVDLVETATGKRGFQERPDPDAIRFVADDTGKLRIKVRARYDVSGLLTGTYDYLYRPAEGGQWTMLEGLTIDGKPVPSFSPVAVDSARNVAYGFVTEGGYDAVAEFALDGTGKGRILLTRSDVDVDKLIRIGRKRRVVGASFATEKRQIAYFDPELAKLARDLGKALPNQPLINLVGASADESRLLLIASSDTQPGMVYLFDKTKRNLEPLLPVRHLLEDRPLGAMRPVTFPARDGTQIPGYLTLPVGSDGKNLPAIILPHGGPSARDEWGFDWLVQYFTARGFAVLQPNYRGSSGYGAQWYGRNGFKAWDVAIGDVNDAGRWLVSQGIARADRLAIVGWSYGGYAALQSQVLEPDLFKAVVAIAPVTDLGFLADDARAYTNSRLVRDFVGEGPHVEAGSPRRHAARFAAPVALFHGTKDLNVEVRHSQAMERALKSAGKTVLYREYKDQQHALADTRVRTEMLTDIGRFLDEALSPG